MLAAAVARSTISRMASLILTWSPAETDGWNLTAFAAVSRGLTRFSSCELTPISGDGRAVLYNVKSEIREKMRR